MEFAADHPYGIPGIFKDSSMLMTFVIAAAVAAMLLLIGVRPPARHVEVKRWRREIDALRNASGAAAGERRWPDAIGGHVRTVTSGSRADFH